MGAHHRDLTALTARHQGTAIGDTDRATSGGDDHARGSDESAVVKPIASLDHCGDVIGRLVAVRCGTDSLVEVRIKPLALIPQAHHTGAGQDLLQLAPQGHAALVPGALGVHAGSERPLHAVEDLHKFAQQPGACLGPSTISLLLLPSSEVGQVCGEAL